MDDLSSWLLERLDERETLADRMDNASMHGVESSDEEAWIEAADSDWIRADCESKRRIIADVVPKIDQLDDALEGEYGAGAPVGLHEESGLLLKLLAFPFAEHPGYQEEWKP